MGKKTKKDSEAIAEHKADEVVEETAALVGRVYCFAKEGVTVTAKTLAEAVKKLNKRTDDNGDN